MEPNPDVLDEGTCKERLSNLKIGDHVKVRVDAEHSISATIQRYAERWGTESPDVTIGAIAHIEEKDLRQFRSVKADYFIAYQTIVPARRLTEAEVFLTAQPKVLAKLGESGEIVLYEGEAGWLVALFKRSGKKLQPSQIRYSYGD